jgi:Spy/CpxP family protein refolding chaperone
MTSDHFSFAAATFKRNGVLLLTMNAKFSFLLVSILTATVQFAPMVLAQPPGDRPPRQFQMERRARWASLSEDERARLKAAHQKAMADPAVRAAREKLRQARREFREILRPALLKADPALQPILDKMRAERADRDDRD